jgi:hypothetical protein
VSVYNECDDCGAFFRPEYGEHACDPSALRTSLRNAEQERDTALVTAALWKRLAEELLATLPKCDDHPDRPATKAIKRGANRWCDECAPLDPDYPRAKAIRAIQAALVDGTGGR